MLTRTTWVTAAAAVIAAAVRLSGHDPIGTKVTWDREILPIVQARCVSCHTAGGRAPMSLATYEEARPWARAIREEVLTRRMPQWPVVRGYGDFANDPSLSPFEIALLTSWVDGGAPKTRAPGAVVRTSLAPAPSQPSPAPPAQTRDVTVPCSDTRLPAGTLVGVRPHAPDGTSVRVTIATTDRGEEPLLWIRTFTPPAEQSYWLRTARRLKSPTPITIAGENCRVTFLFEGRTAR